MPLFIYNLQLFIAATKEEKKDYNELFDNNAIMEESLDMLLEEHDMPRHERRPSERATGLAHFTPRQGYFIFSYVPNFS